MSNIPELTYPEFKRYARHCLNRRISVFAQGHPGCGKSTLAHELAQEATLPLIDIRMAQQDPAEIGGIHVPDHATRTLITYVPDWVHRAATQPVLIFLDECNLSVTRLHQACMYSILLDRKVGEVRFHPDTLIMAAGNLLDDGPIVVPLADALLDRVWKGILKPNAEVWLNWAMKQDLSPDILAYIAWRRESVLFKRSEGALADPRSWHRAALLDYEVGTGAHADTMRRKLVAGCIGEGQANEWWAFVKTYRSLDLDGILLRGVLPTFPDNDPSVLYAATFAIAARLTDGKLPKNRTALYTNLARLVTHPQFTPEYQTLLLKQIHVKNSALLDQMLDHPSLSPLVQRLNFVLNQWADAA